MLIINIGLLSTTYVFFKFILLLQQPNARLNDHYWKEWSSLLFSFWQTSSILGKVIALMHCTWVMYNLISSNIWLVFLSKLKCIGFEICYTSIYLPHVLAYFSFHFHLISVLVLLCVFEINSIQSSTNLGCIFESFKFVFVLIPWNSIIS